MKTQTEPLKLFITGHKGFETLLFHELRDLFEPMPEPVPEPESKSISVAESLQISKVYGGVELLAGLSAAYRVCLHSRLANRVYCQLSQAKAENEVQLYNAVAQIDWSSHLNVDNHFAVSATVSSSKLDHSQYVALKTKDAIVDQFRQQTGERPSISKTQPDLQVHVNIHQNKATISLDLSGESLHRRGYRLQHGGAPLKEHLAAAMLIQAGWNQNSAIDLRLVDPMCGSGTFAIEAAMIAIKRAPALDRRYFGFLQWRRHEPDLWQSCLSQAQSEIADESEIKILAYDYDLAVLEIAEDNAKRAKVDHLIQFSHQQISELKLPDSPTQTLVIANPPYGKRMQSEQGLGQMYADLGALVQRLGTASLALISANPDMLHRLKLLRSSRKSVKNGPLDCIFGTFETNAKTTSDTADSIGGVKPTAVSAQGIGDGSADDCLAGDRGDPALRNRLLKNKKHWQRWARKQGVGCYRLYDADLPEYAFALDCYQSEISPGVQWLHLQEYKAPASIEPEKASARIEMAKFLVQEIFELPKERLFCKIRSRQRGSDQYQKQNQQGEFFQVREGSASLLVNLSDYLDSGLFLDHRLTRERVRREADNKSVLNLFCYTGSVGVQAGLGGASQVLNVDLSNTYLKWAAENHKLNGLDDLSRYQFLRADVVDLLANPSRHDLNSKFDLIFLDPPSFSNSDKMQQTLDTKRDHQSLIEGSMELLADDGLMLFSCNRRGFKLTEAIEQQYQVVDISQATIPEDFKRSPRIHQCWEIRHSK